MTQLTSEGIRVNSRAMSGTATLNMVPFSTEKKMIMLRRSVSLPWSPAFSIMETVLAIDAIPSNLKSLSGLNRLLFYYEGNH
jgi:hypothetical protein